MQKSDQNHPIWRFLNLLVVAGLVTVFAWSGASNFDETEVKLIGQILLFIGGYEVLKDRFFSKKNEDDEGQ